MESDCDSDESDAENAQIISALNHVERRLISTEAIFRHITMDEHDSDALSDSGGVSDPPTKKKTLPPETDLSMYICMLLQILRT